jgi:hypothetical protein
MATTFDLENDFHNYHNRETTFCACRSVKTGVFPPKLAVRTV